MSSLHLFEATGIEIEYMIVDEASLDVRALADRLLRDVANAPTQSIERGPIAWSNELALHVIEFKTNGPTPNLAAGTIDFQNDVLEANRALSRHGARLLPTGMHPWMDPLRELRLWPHEDDLIYRTFDRIFDCRGHGWANLQSMHINLPFSGDAEFGPLHAAIRLLLPLLPALAASSPLQDGRLTGFSDTRLVHYGSNARRVPSVCGKVVPEPVFTQAAYQRLLESIYLDLEPHDPDGVLREEWVNARGAIARFDRGSIEIRLIDTQECVAADLAIAQLVVDVLQQLTERAGNDPTLKTWSEDRLAALLEPCIVRGDAAWIDDADYVELLTGRRTTPIQAGHLWSHLADAASTSFHAAQARCLETLFSQGCLASRITRRLERAPSRSRLRELYAELADCLAEGQQLTG